MHPQSARQPPPAASTPHFAAAGRMINGRRELADEMVMSSSSDVTRSPGKKFGAAKWRSKWRGGRRFVRPSLTPCSNRTCTSSSWLQGSRKVDKRRRQQMDRFDNKPAARPTCSSCRPIRRESVKPWPVGVSKPWRMNQSGPKVDTAIRARGAAGSSFGQNRLIRPRFDVSSPILRFS